MTDPHPAPAEAPLVEAARHALLRRLAPALRHDAVASLQPIALAGGVLERRLQQAPPDLKAVQGAAQQLIDCSRHAVQSSLDLIAWLGLDAAQEAPLSHAVDHAVGLLQGALGFRGIALRVQPPIDTAPVAGVRLRYLLPACLLLLADGASAPAEILIRSPRASDPGAPDPAPPQLLLSLVATPDATGAHLHADAAAYRPLREDEVRALAAAENVALDWSGDTLTLTIAR